MILEYGSSWILGVRMSILKKFKVLVGSLIKEDLNSTVTKYLYPLQVIDCIETPNGVKVTLEVPDDMCYIINSIPVTYFSNQIYLDQSSYPKAFIESYRMKEKDISMGGFEMNNHPFKVLIRYNSSEGVCEVLNPQQTANYSYSVYKEYELQAGLPTKPIAAVVELPKPVAVAKLDTSTISLSSISAGSHTGGISSSVLLNCVYTSITGGIGSVRLKNVIVLKSITISIGEFSGEVYCLPTTKIKEGIGQNNLKVHRLSEAKLILKAQELDLL
jgi:hypothetical protein